MSDQPQTTDWAVQRADESVVVETLHIVTQTAWENARCQKMLTSPKRPSAAASLSGKTA
jgi:hypothetical protein